MKLGQERDEGSRDLPCHSGDSSPCRPGCPPQFSRSLLGQYPPLGGTALGSAGSQRKEARRGCVTNWVTGRLGGPRTSQLTAPSLWGCSSPLLSHGCFENGMKAMVSLPRKNSALEDVGTQFSSYYKGGWMQQPRSLSGYIFSIMTAPQPHPCILKRV